MATAPGNRQKTAPAPDTPTNILILGSGGREHALGWKLKQSPKTKKIFFAPGNGGTAQIGENVDLPWEPVTTKAADDIDYFARHNNVGLIVVGPEDPLCEGIVDRLQAKGHRVFGPTAAGARLEGDKAYCKQLMRAANVPTGDFKVFTDYEQAKAYVEARELPVVVKAAGLAKGKGVVVCDDAAEASEAVTLIMRDKAFGEAGDVVVVEERLVGQELSVLAFVDGRNIYIMDPSQDHKQVGEGDTGPNTGGMGAYCPTPLVKGDVMTEIERDVFVPIVDALYREEADFKGMLFAGLMLTAGGVKVLEFNTRFGDPECQPLMWRLKGDLYDIMNATIDGKLDEIEMGWDKKVACCVVLCAGGYPGKYDKGDAITGITDAEACGEVKVFQAGTKLLKDGTIVTNGGRVLNVVALGDDLASARDLANEAASKIKFKGAFFRKDIGHRVM